MVRPFQAIHLDIPPHFPLRLLRLESVMDDLRGQDRVSHCLVAPRDDDVDARQRSVDVEERLLKVPTEVLHVRAQERHGGAQKGGLVLCGRQFLCGHLEQSWRLFRACPEARPFVQSDTAPEEFVRDAFEVYNFGEVEGQPDLGSVDSLLDRQSRVAERMVYTLRRSSSHGRARDRICGELY